MSIVRAYAAHPDPLTAACNHITLLVASSQPFYPFYIRWLVGGDWQAGFWTFLSTPCFAAIPAIARRRPALARALLPSIGILNGIVSTKAFGEASAVELFLLPCALIALLASRGPIRIVLLAAVVAAALLHGHYGGAFGRFDADRYRAFRRLNAYSATLLSAMAWWMLSRARRSSARR